MWDLSLAGAVRSKGNKVEMKIQKKTNLMQKEDGEERREEHPYMQRIYTEKKFYPGFTHFCVLQAQNFVKIGNNKQFATVSTVYSIGPKPAH